MLAHPTIFPARKIITMNPSLPEATAVAVRDGRILAVGNLSDLRGWGAFDLDDTFRDKVLMPGFVEAHSHVLAGALWDFVYTGYFDRRDPDGKLWNGCKSIAAVLARLREAAVQVEEPEAPLIAWGLDPIYFPGERLAAAHLDEVSNTRSVFVFHASAHLATVNSALMRKQGITPQTTVEGVARGPDGSPLGELREPAAMMLAGPAFAALFASTETTRAIWNTARLARNAGVTMFTDLGSARLYSQQVLDLWQEAVNDPAYPGRAALAYSPLFGGPGDPNEAAGYVAGLAAQSTDKLRFGQVKLHLDGSIQGFTARVGWPGYLSGDGHGQWLIDPSLLKSIVLAYHRAGLTVHAHCNGDEASSAFVDAVEAALREHPRWDHRHTVQHCQLATSAQYRRMAALGICANIFSNHLYYWGDQHRDITIGPERAALMDACATAKREGVRFAIHSDAPVTPFGGLHLAWCAANRLTASGQALGEHERIPVYDALRAVTLDAAYTLRMDGEIGSIECGKWADFAVLEDDPLTVDPTAIKDIPVWGTIVAGVPHAAGA